MSEDRPDRWEREAWNLLAPWWDKECPEFYDSDEAFVKAIAAALRRRDTRRYDCTTHGMGRRVLTEPEVDPCPFCADERDAQVEALTKRPFVYLRCSSGHDWIAEEETGQVEKGCPWCLATEADLSKIMAKEEMKMRIAAFVELDAARAQIKEVQARIDDAGRHLECRVYEREDIQDYLRHLRAATEDS